MVEMLTVKTESTSEEAPTAVDVFRASLVVPGGMMTPRKIVSDDECEVLLASVSTAVAAVRMPCEGDAPTA